MALERRVLNILGPSSRITRVVWLRDRQELNKRLPDLGTGPGFAPGPVWLVRAHGLFQLVTVPPGGHQITKPRNGWYVFDDKTGVSLAYGF
jgi:hypothetical protein